MSVIELTKEPRLRPARDDGVAFDVGMHRGEDSAYYLAKGFSVVGFEANPELVAACRERFAAEIADGRMTIVHGAIVDPAERLESVRFFRHPSLSMWGTTDADWVSRREFVGEFERVDVPAVDFSESLAEFGVPHFIKIDIEGADALCLEALRVAGAQPRYLSIESEKFDFAALEAEFDALEALGYNRFAVVQQGSIPGSEIRTSRRDGSSLHYRFEADSSGGFGPDVGPWMHREDAIRRYRKIFREYRMFGETSPLRKVRLGRIALARLPRYTGRSWPGWYDTHAARD